MMMQRVKIIGSCFAVVFALSGCRVDFKAQSIVAEDGSLERTVMWKGFDESDKEEILERYEVPPGGEWSEEKPASDAKPSPVYTLKRVFSPEQFPATDYKRFTEKRDNAAVNKFFVETRDRWFVKSFTYREEFKDVLDREHIMGLLDGVMEKALAAFHATLIAGNLDEAQSERLTSMVRAQYKPLIGRLAHELAERGPSGPRLESIFHELEQDFQADKIYEMIVKEVPEFNTPQNQALIEGAFAATEAKLSEEIEPVRESIFGIHGLAVLQNYNFNVRLKMPGKVIQSNADRTENGFLTWEFDSGAMDQVLTARSRKVYWDRIWFAGAVLLFLVFFLRRRR